VHGSSRGEPESPPGLAAALAYADAGLRVFPTDGKRPPLRFFWPVEASTDPERIRTWWARWPDAGVGWAIPPGVVVADVDPPDGAAYAKAAGGLPHGGPVATTPRGGWHVVLALPDEGPWAQRQPAPSVDSRVGGSGYIVLPDARPERAWFAPPGRLEDLVTPAALPPAPGWVVDALRDRPRERPAAGEPLRGDDPASRGLRAAILADELAGPPLAPNDRHAAYLRVGRRLRGLGAGPDELGDALETLNVTRGAPPKAGREWAAERDGLVAWLLELAPDLATAAPPDPDEVPPGGFPEPENRGLAVRSPRADDELVADLVRPSRILVLAAEEGAGKSHAMGELGIRAALGTGAFAGAWPIVRPARVLSLSEMHPDDDFDLEARILAALERTRAELDGCYYRLGIAEAAAGVPPLLSAAWRAWAGAWLRERRIDLLVVDTVTSAAPVDPWGEPLLRLMADLRALLAAVPELALVLVVHLRKPTPGRGDRGELADVLGWFGRFADVVLLLSREDDERTRLVSRKRVRQERRLLVTRADGLLVDPVDLAGARGPRVGLEAVVAKVTASPGLTYAELGAELGVAERTARRYVAAGETAGRLRVERRVGGSACVFSADTDGGVGQMATAGHEDGGRPPTVEARGSVGHPLIDPPPPLGGEGVADLPSHGDPAAALPGPSAPEPEGRPVGPWPTPGLNLDAAGAWDAIDAAGGVRGSASPTEPPAVDDDDAALVPALIDALRALSAWDPSREGRHPLADVADATPVPLERVRGLLLAARTAGYLIEFGPGQTVRLIEEGEVHG
jgi:hypothetical protein